MKILQKIKKNKKEIIILSSYAIVTFLVTIIFHEKWRDEAQAWMISRDLSFLGIIKQMSYEGHPPLWYFICMIFSKLGLPYLSQSFISWGIMVVTAVLIYKKAPFNKVIKFFLLTSLPFIYLYIAISRSYCLIALILVLIAIIYPKRNEKPILYAILLLLLAYTHVLILGLVGALYTIFFFENIIHIRKVYKEEKDISKLILKFVIWLFITFAGLIILFFILRGGTDKNAYVHVTSLTEINIEKIDKLIDSILIGLFGEIGRSTGFKLYFIIGCFFLFVSEFVIGKRITIAGTIGVLWQIFIYLCIYGVSNQKANILVLIVLFVAWINRYKNKEEVELMTKFEANYRKVIYLLYFMIIILSSMEGANQLISDIYYNYSDAKYAGDYIQNNTEENSIFIAQNAPCLSAIIPYTENRIFWNAVGENEFTFVTWNQNSYQFIDINYAIEKANSNFKEGSNVYFIQCDINNKSDKEKSEKERLEIEDLEQKGVISKVYTSSKMAIMKDEMYNIYKINIGKKY